MYAAIQLEKIDLENSRVIFRPVGVIKGYYDEELDLFTTKSGDEYEIMKKYTIVCENYFCDPIKINQLREIYDNQLSDMEILEEYLANYMDVCYIGCLDYDTGMIKVTELDLYKLERKLFDSDNEISINEMFDLENNQKFTFDLRSLKKIKGYQTLEEVREFIDKLIYAGNYINNVMQKTIVNNQSLDDERFVLEWDTPYTILGIEENKCSKKELLDIVKKCINDINTENLNSKQKNKKIDSVLDSYNYIIKQNFQKTKKLR